MLKSGWPSPVLAPILGFSSRVNPSGKIDVDTFVVADFASASFNASSSNLMVMSALG